MRVLITGGAGFIGSHIADLCIRSDHRVRVIDDLSNGRISNIPRVDREQFYCDTICNAKKMIEIAKDFMPDVVCHQAAQPSLRRSIETPEYDALINIVGTINVIAAAKAVNARLLFASTSAVYDADGIIPFVENDPIAPNLPYGIAKASAEMYIVNSGLSYAILRYGNVYGPRQRAIGENQLIPHCLDQVLLGKPFVINGDGYQCRDFVYVEDIARANLAAIESQECGIFNCGSGETISVNTVCDAIANLTTWDRVFEHGPAKAGEMRHSGLNSKRADKVLGWSAKTLLVDGLKKTIEWYRGE